MEQYCYWLLTRIWIQISHSLIINIEEKHKKIIRTIYILYGEEMVHIVHDMVTVIHITTISLLLFMKHNLHIYF